MYLPSLGFLPPPPLSVAAKTPSRGHGLPKPSTVSPRMILQRPDADGPPSLEDYFSTRRSEEYMDGPPVTIGTGRANVATCDGSVATAVEKAVQSAKAGLFGEDIDLVHVLCAPELEVGEVNDALRSQVGDTSVMGRVVSRREKEGTVEILALRSGIKEGVGFEEGSFPVEDVGEGTRGLIRKVSEKLRGVRKTFWVFCCDEDVEEAHIREIFAEEEAGSFAYGGRALRKGVIGGGNSDGCTVQVAAVCGAVNFLQSSVVKNWTQPVYFAALDFLTPKYAGEAATDLLTAIRFNDWKMFIKCLEVEKVDVNHKWVAKQSQIPLLAACARGRTEMIEYLLQRGADVEYTNDGGFNAKMYTMKLDHHGEDFVRDQLEMLRRAGADISLSAEERERLEASNAGSTVYSK